jgi:hypothetical protein
MKGACGPGFHLAFAASSRQAVDDFHRAALAAGGFDNGKPGVRPGYGPNYYAAFVVDPDGYRLEAVFHDPVWWSRPLHAFASASRTGPSWPSPWRHIEFVAFWRADTADKGTAGLTPPEARTTIACCRKPAAGRAGQVHAPIRADGRNAACHAANWRDDWHRGTGPRWSGLLASRQAKPGASGIPHGGLAGCATAGGLKVLCAT